MTINEATRTYRLPNPTTPEDLECRWSKVLNFGDKVLLAGYYYNGKNKPCPPARLPSRTTATRSLGRCSRTKKHTPIRISAGAALTGLYLVAQKIREGLFFMPFWR